MKKNYFYALFASLMLFMAMPASAQVTMVDLYGKWKFTADIEWGATATEEQKAQISNECDVIIAADDITGWYEAKIVGFAGSKNPQLADMFQSPSSGVYAAKVANPNPTQGALFNDMLLANANGDNPYGIFEGGEWVVKSLGTFYYILNEDKTEMKVQNDFTIVTLTSHEDKNPVVVATLRNAKMTLVEPATPVAVSDISGDYIFKAGTGQWSTMEGSAIPTEFSVNIVSKSEDNKAYDATIAIEGYDNVTLPATFDGSVLSLAFNNTYIKSDYAEVENSIRFADYYAPEEKEGAIEFKAIENAFSLSSGICLASDSIGKNMAGDADSTWVVTRQYYMDGSLKLRADAPAFDWAGVYTVKTTDENGLYVAEAAGFDWPTEFQIEVEYNEGWDMYLVTKVFGLDVVALNYGGLEFTPSEDGKSVDISTGNLYTVKPGEVYLALRDMNMATDAIEMVVNEDGTMTVAGLSIVTTVSGVETPTLNAFYSNLAVTKEGADPEAPAEFDWTGTWEVTVGNQTSYDGKTYPESFYMTIEHNEGWGMTLITQFMSTDVAGVNYGGILLTIAEDNKSAEMELDVVAGGSYPDYLKIYDMNGTADYPVVLTANEDGTISFENFFLANYNWDTTAKTPAVFYENVTATKCPTNIEEVKGESAKVKGIFDMQGRKVNAITAPGLYIVDGKKVLVK